MVGDSDRSRRWGTDFCWCPNFFFEGVTDWKPSVYVPARISSDSDGLRRILSTTSGEIATPSHGRAARARSMGRVSCGDHGVHA
jgi:hypothetical protein